MPELEMMHRWLDNWVGVGLIATGMERQGYRLHLTNAEAGVWRATFSRHPMTSAEGFGAAATPWGAVQEAAWAALKDDPGVSVKPEPTNASQACFASTSSSESPRPPGQGPRYRRHGLVAVGRSNLA